MAVTRNDIARAAGVSPAVVSYVINDGPRPVAAATRERVLDAIQRLNYRPNAAARALRGGQSSTLGLVVPDAANPFFTELAKSMGDEGFVRGFGLLVCDSANDPDRERAHIVRLAERRVTGIVLISSVPDRDVSDLVTLGIPVVALDRSPDDSPVSTIRADHEAGAFLATMHLVEHGHRRIAFVGGPDFAVTDQRQSGWERALTASGRRLGATVETQFSFEGGREAATSLFGGTSARPPSAVVVSSDVQSLGLLHELDRLGPRVPEDVAVVSFDGTQAGHYAVPRLTSVVQPIAEMGARTVDHLAGGVTNGPMHLTLDTRLAYGHSCGCSYS